MSLIDSLQEKSPKAFMTAVLQEIYPIFFEEHKLLCRSLQNALQDYDVDLMLSMANHMDSEMDMLYRKEKMVLFPFINRLDAEHKKSPSCKPFKHTKLHFTSILKMSHDIKAGMSAMASEHFIGSELEDIFVDISRLEQWHIALQRAKDKFLFASFKNCGVCGT